MVFSNLLPVDETFLFLRELTVFYRIILFETESLKPYLNAI